MLTRSKTRMTTENNSILSMIFDSDSGESYYPSSDSEIDYEESEEAECEQCVRKLTFETDDEDYEDEEYEGDEDECDEDEDEGDEDEEYEGDEDEEYEGDEDEEDEDEDEGKSKKSKRIIFNMDDILEKITKGKKQTEIDIQNLLLDEDDFVVVTSIKDDLKKKYPDSNVELENIMKHMKDNLPNILDILNMPIDITSKCELFELFEVLLNTEPGTLDFIKLKNLLIKKCSTYEKEVKDKHSYDEEKVNWMKEEEEKIKRVSGVMSKKYKILSMNTSIYNKEIIYRKYKELQHAVDSDEDHSKMKNWFDLVLKYPWGVEKKWPEKTKNIKKFMCEAFKKLDDELYGMEKVKEQILIFLMNKLLYTGKHRYNLGLLGEPGTGKTTIAKVISELLDIGFEQISFGGMDRSEYMKGHDYTYVGSQPGMLVKSIIKMGHVNGVILLDEYDKISPGGSLANTMLHITDPSQNKDFKDSYMSDLSIDLSKIWFIYSMNDLPQDPALRDRMFIVKVPSYKNEERKHILTEYILPRILKRMDLDVNYITLSDECVENIVRKNTGIRSIEKLIMDLVDKLIFLNNVQDDDGNVSFSVSFKCKEKISFPLTVEQTLFNQITKSYDDNTMDELSREKLATMYT